MKANLLGQWRYLFNVRSNKRDQSAAFPDHFRAKSCTGALQIMLISIFTLEKAFWGSIRFSTS